MKLCFDVECLWGQIDKHMNLGHQIKAKQIWESVPLAPEYYSSDKGLILNTRHHKKI